MPTTSALPSPAVTLRPATEDDQPFLLSLREQTMDPHLRAAGAPVDAHATRERVLLHFDIAQVIEAEGQAIGLLKVVKDIECWTVLQVQLLPAWQGRQIGFRLLSAVLREAEQAGVAVELSVLKLNPARRLYERLGFVQVSEGEYSFLMRLEQPGA